MSVVGDDRVFFCDETTDDFLGGLEDQLPSDSLCGGAVVLDLQHRNASNAFFTSPPLSKVVNLQNYAQI